MLRSANFNYKNGRLHCEDLDLGELVDQLQTQEKSQDSPVTPVYVYSKQQIMSNIRSYKEAFKERSSIIGFSVKVVSFNGGYGSTYKEMLDLVKMLY